MQSGILALDLATRTGWAAANAEAIANWPRGGPVVSERGPVHGAASGHLVLGNKLGQKLHNLDNLICALAVDHDVGIIVFEAPFMRGASTRALFAMAGVAELAAHRLGILVREANNLTVKKHFTGYGTAKKHQMADAAKDLGFSPKSHDEADAIAVLDYAIACLAPNPKKDAA